MEAYKMSDGYIQSKQRELDDKLNTLLSKVDVLDKKMEHIDNKSDDFNQLLSDIKKEHNRQKHIKDELEKETKRTINNMIPKVQTKLHKKIETDFNKHQDHFNGELDRMQKSTTMLLNETQTLLQIRLQLTILAFILYKQGIIDKKEFDFVKKAEKMSISKNKEVMDMLTEIREM